jgi:hypothetical protein
MACFSKRAIPASCVMHEPITLYSKLSTPHIGNTQNAKSVFTIRLSKHGDWYCNPRQTVIKAIHFPRTCYDSRPVMQEWVGLLVKIVQ